MCSRSLRNCETFIKRSRPLFSVTALRCNQQGVVARDLSEKIEAAIEQHCASFSKGAGHNDLTRAGCEWEVKVCKDSGLTINQSKRIAGENYIVVNYTTDPRVVSVWVLWDARDEFFSPRKGNTNARSLLKSVAAGHIEVLYQRKRSTVPPLGAFTIEPQDPTDRTAGGPRRQPIKAQLRRREKREAS